MAPAKPQTATPTARFLCRTLENIVLSLEQQTALHSVPVVACVDVRGGPIDIRMNRQYHFHVAPTGQRTDLFTLPLLICL